MLVSARAEDAGASVGHAALMVWSHNWWYGQALPRKASGKILRRHLRDPYWVGKDRQVN